MRINPPKNKKRIIIAAAVLLLIAAIVAGAYAWNVKNIQEKRDEKGVSLERTKQDKALEEAIADDPTRKTEQTQTDRPISPSVNDETDAAQVNAVLTSVSVREGTVRASGFVSNTVETEGSCTYIFENGTRKIEKREAVLANANSTTCKTAEFPVEELSVGTWQTWLQYRSATSSGISNKMELDVR